MSSQSPARPFHFPPRRSCYASVQLRHLLIHNSCSLLVRSHTPKPLHYTAPFFLLLPSSSKLKFWVPRHKICLHHSTSHSANGLCLLVCVRLHVTSREGCHLFSRRHFGCSLQHSSSGLVILSTMGTRGSQCVASCSNTSTTYYSRVSGTNVSNTESSVAQPILYHGSSYLIRVLLSSHCLIAFKLL